jgi:hypothetical protein
VSNHRVGTCTSRRQLLSDASLRTCPDCKWLVPTEVRTFVRRLKPHTRDGRKYTSRNPLCPGSGKRRMWDVAA